MKLELFNLARKIHAINHQFGGIDQLNITDLPGQHKVPLINAASGIIPVASVSDSNPTNLENCTDGDWSSVTGTGSKVLGASGDIGRLTFTLPRYSIYLAAAIVGVWSTAGTVNVRFYSSIDLSTYVWSGLNAISKISTTESHCQTMPGILIGQSVQLVFQLNAAGTGNVKVYEFFAFDLAGS